MLKLIFGLCILSTVLNSVFCDCNDPGLVPYSTREVVGLSDGDIVNYTCSVGYKIQGEPVLTVTVIRTCDNVTWSGTQPVCEEIQCPDPGDVANSNKTVTSYGYQGTVTYTCDLGYRTPGGSRVFTLTCQEDELWNRNPPTCTRVQCSPPEEIPDSTHDDQLFFYKDVVTYTCNAGYEVTFGNLSLICNDIGGWTGDWPLCTRKVCGDPGDLAHSSRLLTGVRYESSVYYTCLAGFYHDPNSGPLNKTCQVSGTWSGSPPVCLGTLCGKPQEPANAKRIPENATFRYPDSVKYECNPGYRADFTGGGVSEITCREDGTWDFDLMTCTRIHCNDNTQPVNAYEPTETFYFEDKKIYTCKPGYQLGTGNLTRICQADGTFSGQPPVCKELSCPTLSNISHATREGFGERYQDSVTYTCDLGYQIEGEINSFKRVLFCQANALWTDAEPACIPLDCGKPDSGQHLTVVSQNGTGYKDTVEMVCEDGYELQSGDLIRQCQANSTWSGQDPVCAPISCGDPPTKDHVIRFGNTFTYPSRVFYTCSPGYEKDQNASGSYYACLSDKTWGGGQGSGVPDCKPVECYKPSQISGATLHNDSDRYFYQDTVIYSCDYGREWLTTSGPLQRSCTGNKQWSLPAPICQRKSCGDPGDIEGTVKQGFSFRYTDTVNYTCKPGYEVHSGRAWSVVTCEENGTWTGTFPACKRIECPDPGLGEHSTRVVRGFLFQDVIEYTCDENYRVESGIYRLQCTETKKWSFPLPECVPVEGINATIKVDANMGPAVESANSNLIGKISIICISIEFGVMVVLDLTTLWKDLRIGIKNIRYGMKKFRAKRMVSEDRVSPLTDQD